MIDPAPSAAPSGRTISLPLAALSVEGVAPAQGDTVSLAVEARLASVQGEEATLEIVSLNGEPVGAAPVPEDEDEAMMRAAAESDANA